MLEAPRLSASRAQVGGATQSRQEPTVLPCRTVDPELFPTMTGPIIDRLILVRLRERIVAAHTAVRAATHAPGGRA